MPTIASFYGIMIMMYLKDKEHEPPHIHAFYGNFCATFTIKDGKHWKGEFPKNGIRLVEQFVKKYSKELEQMWETGIYKRLPLFE